LVNLLPAQIQTGAKKTAGISSAKTDELACCGENAATLTK